MLALRGPAKGTFFKVLELLETFPIDHHVLGGLALAGQPAKRCAAGAFESFILSSVG